MSVINENISIKIREVRFMSWDIASVSVSARPYHALVFRLCGSASFSHENLNSSTNVGDVFYMPANYSYKATYQKKNEILVIHFESDLISKMENYQLNDSHIISILFHRLYDIWNKKEDGYGYPCIGIASYVQHHPGGAVSPVCLAKARDAENNPSHGDGYHNCYDVTLSVNLKARTTYYLYLFIEGDSTSSSLAWLPLTHPLTSTSDRTTLVELHYNSYEYSAPPTNYTVTLNKGTGISSVTGGGTYQSGTSVSISATPSSGYEFKK